MPKIVLLHAWRDAAAWHAGRKLIEVHEPLRAEFAAQRKRPGGAVFQRAEVNLLDPAPGANIRAALGRLVA